MGASTNVIDESATALVAALDNRIEVIAERVFGRHAGHGPAAAGNGSDSEDEVPPPLKMKAHAIYPLRKIGHPVRYRDLLRMMEQHGFRSWGRTPWDSISALPNHNPDVFTRPNRGMIGLREWD